MKLISLVRKRTLSIFFVYFFLFFLILYNLLFNTFDYSHSILIKPQQSLKEISRSLYKHNIIKNQYLFEFLIRISMNQKTLKAGEYKFFKNNIFQVISKLKQGDVVQRRVTIPEGLTSVEIVNILKNTEGILVNKGFNIPLEGSLFPNTYFYLYGTKIETVIYRMQQSMDKVLKDFWDNKHESVNLDNINELLILASIIEKETSIKEEKAVIAQVFLNRLNLNMKLQSDPTVVYGIKKKFPKFDKKLTRDDLVFDSKYNTYKSFGLPKGPICNPGKDSIQAASRPKKTNFLYFVADNYGGHIFSTNYKGHLKNIENIKNNKLN